MNKENKLWHRVVSVVLVVAVMFCSPIEALAQAANASGNILEKGTHMLLYVTEDFKAANNFDSGVINSIVSFDVYSADGTTLLVKAGTPVLIDYTVDSNGCWGKAGKLCLSRATTKTVDNKNVTLDLGTCKSGGSRLGGVIVLSVLFFPIGLISGCMKGSMPELKAGTTLNAFVAEPVPAE